MGDPFTFDLNIEPEADNAKSSADGNRAEELSKWAEGQLADPSPLFFDIETGPLPDDQLRAIYHEKTLDEFAATCDKRWKSDTVAAKYEQYKASAWDEFVGKSALSPITGRVLLIGMMVYSNTFSAIGYEEEKQTLRSFWEFVGFALSNKNRIIGHNSNGFDVPFLVRRSWILGVHVPREIRQGRYWNPLFIDTMEAWGCGGRDFIGLNDLAACFGVGQKTEGFAGKDFAKYWFGTAEERNRALEYCEQDVRLTAAIAAKMGLT